jgi:hypothetical protein
LDKREGFVSEAVSYANKALALNPANEDTAGVHLFQIAGTFEAGWRVVKATGCLRLYQQATKLLESRTALLKGNRLVSKGKVIPVASYAMRTSEPWWN